MLIDCGATSSLINPEVLPKEEARAIENYLKHGTQPDFIELKKSKIKMTAAIGKKVSDCAIGTINFSIGEWNGSHEFIFTDIQEKAILRMDFLQKYGAFVDMKNRVVKLSEDNRDYVVYDQKIGETKRKERFIMRIDNDLILEPRTENLVRIKVPDEQLKGVELVFEPRPQTEQEFCHGILFATSVGSMDSNNSIAVSVLNLSDDRFKLSKDTEIGVLERPFKILEKSKKSEHEKNTSTSKDWSKININSKLHENEKTALMDLLKKYENNFQWSEYDTGLTNKAEHRIDTGNARPIKQAQYRLPQVAHEEIGKQVNTMLENQIIEDSRSPWSSPILLVQKKPDADGKRSFRFCIDFRKLNAVTVKDCYPLPRIDDTVDALSGSKYFTTLDLASGYWQVPLSEKDKEKTAFSANSRLYQFKLMPFGLSNAPSTFQRLMDSVLRNLTWTYLRSYAKIYGFSIHASQPWLYFRYSILP